MSQTSICTSDVGRDFYNFFNKCKAMRGQNPVANSSDSLPSFSPTICSLQALTILAPSKLCIAVFIFIITVVTILFLIRHCLWSCHPLPHWWHHSSHLRPWPCLGPQLVLFRQQLPGDPLRLLRLRRPALGLRRPAGRWCTARWRPWAGDAAPSRRAAQPWRSSVGAGPPRGTTPRARAPRGTAGGRPPAPRILTAHPASPVTFAVVVLAIWEPTTTFALGGFNEKRQMDPFSHGTNSWSTSCSIFASTYGRIMLLNISG